MSVKRKLFKCFIDGFILWKFQFLFVYQLKDCIFCFSVIKVRVFEPIILILFSCENNFRFSFFRVQVSVLNNYNTFKFKFRSEEHTSELQSRENLVCRLLLEKKKNKD